MFLHIAWLSEDDDEDRTRTIMFRYMRENMGARERSLTRLSPGGSVVAAVVDCAAALRFLLLVVLPFSVGAVPFLPRVVVGAGAGAGSGVALALSSMPTCSRMASSAGVRPWVEVDTFWSSISCADCPF
jgi:acetyl esterase/lipase